MRNLLQTISVSGGSEARPAHNSWMGPHAQGGGSPAAAAGAVVYETLPLMSLVMTIGMAMLVVAVGFQTPDKLQKGRRALRPKTL